MRINLDANRVGATLRVDLPTREGGLTYLRKVARYLAHDASATRMLFAVYTSERQKPAQLKPHAATIAARTCALAERGMSIRDGLLSEARPFHSTTAIPETTSSCSERNGSSSSRGTRMAAAVVERSGADKTIAPGVQVAKLE